MLGASGKLPLALESDRGRHRNPTPVEGPALSRSDNTLSSIPQNPSSHSLPSLSLPSLTPILASSPISLTQKCATVAIQPFSPTRPTTHYDSDGVGATGDCWWRWLTYLFSRVHRSSRSPTCRGNLSAARTRWTVLAGLESGSFILPPATRMRSGTFR